MDKKKFAELVSVISAASAALADARNTARRALRECLSTVGKIEFPAPLVDAVAGDQLEKLADSLERMSVNVTAFPDTSTSEVRGFVSAIRYDKDEDEAFVDMVYYRGNKPMAETFRLHEVVEQENLLEFVGRFSE